MVPSPLPVPDRRTALRIIAPGYPRPGHGSASKGIAVCRRMSDIPENLDAPGYMAQKYIDNAEEVTVDCYVGADAECAAYQT